MSTAPRHVIVAALGILLTRTHAQEESGRAATVDAEIARAEALVAAGELQEGVRIAQEALDGLVAAQAWDTAFDASSRIVRFFMARDDHVNALAFSRRLLDIARAWPGEDHDVPVAFALHVVALCQDRTGHPTEAVEAWREAAAIQRRNGDDAHLGVTLRLIASTLDNLGRPDEALGPYEDSLAALRRAHGDDHAEIAATLNGLGICHMHRGSWGEAIICYEDCAAMEERLNGPDHPSVATARFNLAIIQSQLGRESEAVATYETVLRIRKKVYGPRHPEVAVVLHNLAVGLDDAGQEAEARARFEEALAIYRDYPRGTKRPTAMTLQSLAILKQRAGDPEGALPLLEEAAKLQRELFGEHSLDLAMTHAQLGSVLLDLGRTDLGVASYRRALDIHRANGPGFFPTATRLGFVYLRRTGQPELAAEVFAEAIADMEESRERGAGLSLEDRARYAGGMRNYGMYDGMIEALALLGRGDQALGYLERARARSLLDLVEEGRFNAVEQARQLARGRGEEETVKQIDAVEGEIVRSEEAIDVRLAELRAGIRDVATLRAVQDALRQAVKAHRSAIRRRAVLTKEALPIAQPADADQLRAFLAHGERMLFYTLTEESGWLFVVSPENVRAVKVEATRQVVERLVTQHLAWIHSPHGDSPARGVEVPEPNAEVDPPASLLDLLVPRELRREILGAERVYLVPDEILHRLPFETLVVREAEATVYWLDAGPPIAYASSGSLHLWCAEQHGNKRDVVALGDVDFGASTALPRLPDSRREVLAIRDAWQPRNVTVLLGKDASRERIEALASKAGYLHLATHQVQGEDGVAGLNRLALADDRSLSLSNLLEHWRGKLSGSELVVLSACQTNVGTEVSGEGVLALPVGFLFAGAPSVIASLWRVEDRSTADLMGDLYSRLGQGEGKLRAFTEARRALRARRPHPYYWAPFVFIGSPR